MTPAEMKQRRCGICGRSEFKKWWTYDGYHIGECTGCKLVQVTEDVPDDVLTALYSRGYYEGENASVYQNYLADPETKGRHFGERLDELARDFNLRPGAMLEIGCAFGLFLDQAKRRGWTVRGTERSAHAASWARTQLGLDVDSSADALARVPDESQDLVILWDVVEHLKEPLDVVKAAYRVLRPGGRFVAATGDIGSLGARFYGRRWFLVAPPYHLFYFDHQSITRLYETGGFTVNRIRNEGGHPLENAGKGSRILNWVAKNDRWIGWRLNSGPTMEVVGTKP